jgi:hypothetical protein
MNFNKSKKNIFKKILIFLIILFILDNLIALGIEKLAEKNITDARIEKILNGEIDKNLLILGSSRAARNINAKIIEEYSGITSYNLGRPGSNVDYHNYLLKLILNYCPPPKSILLVFDNSTLIPAPSLTFRYDLIYQFSNRTVIKNFLIERDQLNKYLSMLSRSYVMKHSFLETFKPHKFILGSNPLYKLASDGSMNLKPNHRKIKYSDDQAQYDQKKESPYLMAKFLEIINLCKENNIKLILVLTPEFEPPMVGLKGRIKSISGDDVPILDYRGVKTLMVAKLFNDGVHLNKLGAIQLSKNIAADLSLLLHEGFENK